MSAILTEQGELSGLEAQLSVIGGFMKVGLFTAPAVPVKATNLAGVTAATFAGYAAQAVVFGGPALDGNDNALAAGSTVTFTAGAVGGAQTILGYYVFDDTNHKLYFIELFSAPVVINASGQFIKVTPNWYRGLLLPPL